MFKIFNKVLLLVFVLHYFVVQASEYPKYKIMDLGTLETDESVALVINDNNQVLGQFKDKGKSHIFLWSESEGLAVANIPDCAQDGEYWLNNRGQITGNYYDSIYKCQRSFIWDRANGFFNIGSLGGNQTRIIAFNDNWQIVGTSRIIEQGEEHIFFWDQGIIRDLTNIIKNQLTEEWKGIKVHSIDNCGQITISAYNSNTKIWKSFLWKDNRLTMILPENDKDASVKKVDVHGNMIVTLSDPVKGGGKDYFINKFGEKMGYLHDGGNYIIRNNLPLKKGCLVGKLKQDMHGENYFAPGIYISKLLVEEFPFYNIGANSTRINDQNSKGYAVGQIDTYTPGYHAFLAVPIVEVSKTAPES